MKPRHARPFHVEWLLFKSPVLSQRVDGCQWSGDSRGIAVGAFRRIPGTAPNVMESICPRIPTMLEFIDGQTTCLNFWISNLRMQIAVFP
jgi:hypothetical protein